MDIMNISQIEIHDIIHCDEQELGIDSNALSNHKKQIEFEENFNNEILIKSKRPYYVLIFISVLFLAVFVMKFIEILKYFEFGGLTPSILCCISLVPIFLCFRYLQSKIILQHEIIFKKIVETYQLKKELQKEKDENLANKKYIDDLKLAIKEQEIQIHKLSNHQNKLKLNQQINNHFAYKHVQSPFNPFL